MLHYELYKSKLMKVMHLNFWSYIVVFLILTFFYLLQKVWIGLSLSRSSLQSSKRLVNLLWTKSHVKNVKIFLISCQSRIPLHCIDIIKQWINVHITSYTAIFMKIADSLFCRIPLELLNDNDLSPKWPWWN